jgi:hypothetical protein
MKRQMVLNEKFLKACEDPFICFSDCWIKLVRLGSSVKDGWSPEYVLVQGAYSLNLDICKRDNISARVFCFPAICWAWIWIFQYIHISTMSLTSAMIYGCLDVDLLMIDCRAWLSVWIMMRWFCSCEPHTCMLARMGYNSNKEMDLWRHWAGQAPQNHWRPNRAPKPREPEESV